MTQQQLVGLRDIFRRVFGRTGVDYDRAIVLPEDDTGGWAPTSLAVIYKEHGIPDRYYYPQLAKKWDQVDEEASTLLCKAVFVEEINGAVSALYPV
jgi:3-mercaptopyruvate sulfurtransferase SseA